MYFVLLVLVLVGVFIVVKYPEYLKTVLRLDYSFLYEFMSSAIA